MDRIYASGASGSSPAVPASPSSGYPTAGNPGTGTPATKPGEYWFYMITEEIRRVISDAGLVPSGASVSQLSTAIQLMISNVAQPVGAFVYFPKDTPPPGYLKANGAAVSRTAYAALFAVCGITFGAGDGSTTFNLPDLRAEFIRGWDDGRGVDSARVIGSSQADGLKSHLHTAIEWRASGFDSTGGPYPLMADTAGVAGVRQNLTENTGGAETRPRNIALLGCIKF